MKFFNILLLGLAVLLSSGCQDRYHKHVTLERDGEVYSIFPDELNESEKNDFEVNIQLEHLQKEYIYGFWQHEITDTDIVVDNHMYSFLIVIPVKTKDNLQSVFSHGSYAKFTRTEISLSYQTYRDAEDYYHYKLYAASNYEASRYRLNDIQDQIFEILYHRNRSFDEDIKITSNQLTIQAEEFEHMLERLAIPHDRLEFQP